MNIGKTVRVVENEPRGIPVEPIRKPIPAPIFVPPVKVPVPVKIGR